MEMQGKPEGVDKVSFVLTTISHYFSILFCLSLRRLSHCVTPNQKKYGADVLDKQESKCRLCYLEGMTHPGVCRNCRLFIPLPLQPLSVGGGKGKNFCLSFSLLLAEIFLDIAELPGERETQRGSSPLSEMISQLGSYCDLPVAAADSLNLCCLFVMQPRQTPK